MKSTDQASVKRRSGAIARIMARRFPDASAPVTGLMTLQGNDPFRILVCAVLSARTRDQVTIRVAGCLLAAAPTPAALSKMTAARLESMIRPCGFYRTKAANLKALARRLCLVHEGRVPDRIDALLALPGVGRKTANLVLSLGFEHAVVSVDVHVHRISNRLGLVDTRTPRKTEEALREILPRPCLRSWNPWLVALGQSICLPRKPRCGDCPLKRYCNLAAKTGKRIVLASPRGFCAGVRHAVEMTETVLKVSKPPVYCLNELVHNRQVVNALARRGVNFISDIANAPRGGCVMFSAHGVAPRIRRLAGRKQLQVFDATCPFVARLHTAVRRYVRQGYHVLLIGNRNHDEVIGVCGEAPGQITVIGSSREASAVSVANPERVAAVTQTTLDAGSTDNILKLLFKRFPNLQTALRGDICFATHNRQQAAREVAKTADMMLVLGSANSSNTNRLVEVCRQQGVHTELISEKKDIERMHIEPVRIMGLTAGASTPDAFVDDMIAYLREKGFQEIVEHVSTQENIHFPLPKKLRLMADQAPDGVTRKPV